MLATTLHRSAGSGATPPLIIAHGLFGSGRNWGVIARRLSDQRDVITVDMRNHGQSPWLPGHSYPELAADLAEVIAAHGGSADLMGHSMGGKAAMYLALMPNPPVRKLIVADIAPVGYAHDQSRHIAAMRSLDLANLTSRTEADDRLSARIEDPALRSFFLQSLDLKSTPPGWRLNLDALEAEMHQITGWPSPGGVFPGPALFLTGALSPYVLAEHRDLIRALFPKARFAKLPGAGHWLHAERPRDFEAAVRMFLNAA